MRKEIISAVLLTVSAFTMSARISHPSLLFTESRVEAAKKNVEKDSVYSKAWSEIRTEADKLLKASNPIDKTEYLALAYMMTGEDRYAQKIKSVLEKAASTESFANEEMMARNPAWRSELRLAWKAGQLAIGYDVIYDKMTPAERRDIARKLYDVMVEPLLGDWLLEPTRIHSLNSMGHNWWTACISGGSLLALSLGNELPAAEAAAEMAVETLPEWFDFDGDVIHSKSKSFDVGGGMYESVNYANFGISQALLLRLAWKNSHPHDSLEEIPAISLIPEFFCDVAYPREGELYSINFGDSHKNVTGEGPVVLSCVLEGETPEALWYLSQIDSYQFREGMPLRFPMGLLYSPNRSKAPERPNLPLSHLWADFGWATMRDSWSKNATMLAVKSGATWNHSHADANSMILFHKGVDIIKDAGNCSYGKPEYRNYFFQSDAHNVVKFNGDGQPRYQQYHGTLLPGSLHYLLEGNGVKYVLADGTGPMSAHLDRNLRSFLWLDNVIFVVDDLHSHKPGEWEWLWHPGGEAKKRGGDLVITKDNSSVVIRPLYPQPLAPSNYVHDYPEMLYWEEIEAPQESLNESETYWSFHLPTITDRVKAVTAIILKDSADQKELPELKPREGRNWIGLRIENGDTITDFYINQLADGRLMHLNSWIEADGWTTDAYMFAVSYRRGGNAANPDRVFINYGSSLRRGEDVYFSSLSKLNAVYNPNGGETALVVNGQPRINLKVKSNGQSIKVNGDRYDARKANGVYTVKIRQAK